VDDTDVRAVAEPEAGAGEEDVTPEYIINYTEKTLRNMAHVTGWDERFVRSFIVDIERHVREKRRAAARKGRPPKAEDLESLT
jgi:hypothetical protein